MRPQFRWVLAATMIAAALLALAPAGHGAPAAEGESTLPPIQTPASNLAKIHRVLSVMLGAFVLEAVAVGAVGLVLLAAALSPERVARAEQALRQGRWRVVIVGLGSIAVLLLGAVGISKAGPVLGAIAVLLLAFLAWLGVFGLAATASLVGQRLLGVGSGAGGHEAPRPPPWRRVGLGAVALAAIVLVPLVGWACFLYLACRGVGAATLSLFARDGGEPPPA